MKISDLIAYVDKITANKFDDAEKIRWINDIEADIQVIVLLTAPEGIVQYTEADMDAELLVPAPHKVLYEEYLQKRICLAQQEPELANMHQVEFEQAYRDYVRWVAKHINPGNGMATTMQYYLTAYQIAVKHGFQGTEEEWLLSLKGDDGEPGPGLVIIDRVDTTEQLPGTGKPGDAYLVGSIGESRLYTWTESTRSWQDQGPLRGPAGKDGLPGTDGVSPTVDVTAIPGGHEVAVTDKDGTETFQVLDGEDGDIPAFATCYDEADPIQSQPNVWYVPKDMPRPTGKVGMMVDVQWANGKADGIGYDVQLIWGTPDGADNEIIVEQTNTSNNLTGEYSIPTEGTVRYQLVEANGRKHWRYVSGPLLSRQFSTDTGAAVADKAIHGMALAYLPGMEVYVTLDQGNTADLMRLVPDEGPTLPVYVNGRGAKTGEIPAGYICHLINAGDHWIMDNLGGGNGGGVSKSYVDDRDADTLQAAKNYTDQHSSTYVLPVATKTDLGGIKADKAQPSDTKGVYIGEDQMLHVTPDVLVVQATNEAGRWVADVGAETIRGFYGNVILKADVDGIPYVYQYQRYGTVETYTGAVFDQPNLQPDAIERIEVIVDKDANVNVVKTPVNLATNATEKVDSTLTDITSLDSFYTHFYNLRKSQVRRYQFEYTQNGTHQNIADAIGLPAEYPAADKGFIYVDLPYSEAGGFMIVVTLEGRTNGQLWRQEHWATLNSTWSKSDWVDQTKEPVGENFRVIGAADPFPADFEGPVIREGVVVPDPVPTGGAYPETAMTAAEAELQPNTFYVWPEMAALKVTLAEELPGVASEYLFQFTSGTAPTTLDVPASVKWAEEPKVEANKTYQVSILKNLGVIYGA